MIEADRLIQTTATREDEVIDRAIRPKRWPITPVSSMFVSKWLSLLKRRVAVVIRLIIY